MGKRAKKEFISSEEVDFKKKLKLISNNGSTFENPINVDDFSPFCNSWSKAQPFHHLKIDNFLNEQVAH